MTIFFLFSTAWAIGTLALLILAVRLSYRIEHRSGIGRARWRIPVKASVITVAFNRGVAGDARTQAMRRRMNLYLLAILAGFILFGGLVMVLGPEGMGARP